MRCKRCNAEFSEGNFCPQCGLPVSAEERNSTVNDINSTEQSPQNYEDISSTGNQAVNDKIQKNNNYGDSFDGEEPVQSPYKQNYADNYNRRSGNTPKTNYVYPDKQPAGNNFPKEEKKGVKGFIIAIVILVVLVIGVGVALVFSLVGGCSNAVKDATRPTNPTAATYSTATTPTEQTYDVPTQEPTQALAPTQEPTQAPTQAPEPTQAPPTQAPTEASTPTQPSTEASSQSTVPSIV